MRSLGFLLLQSKKESKQPSAQVVQTLAQVMCFITSHLRSRSSQSFPVRDRDPEQKTAAKETVFLMGAKRAVPCGERVKTAMSIEFLL